MIGSQKQEVVDGATAIQAGGNLTITTGLSYSEAREVALDVFKANFIELSREAAQVATERAEQITERFLGRLQAENPEALAKALDPDFQYATFTMQKEFARTGDENLGDLLIQLLVDRSKQSRRDLLQIVLNESLNTAPKLTDAQIAALAVIFVCAHTVNHVVDSWQSFGEYLDNNLRPFMDQLPIGHADFQHMEFCGCGSIQLSERLLLRAWKTNYQGLFVNGFTEEEAAAKAISIGLHPELFARCINDSSKLQVRVMTLEGLTWLLDEKNVPADDRPKIIELFNHGVMSDDQALSKCVELRPYMDKFFKAWSSTSLKSFNLTSVGIAIGHAGVRRYVPSFGDLSIWMTGGTLGP